HDHGVCSLYRASYSAPALYRHHRHPHQRRGRGNGRNLPELRQHHQPGPRTDLGPAPGQVVARAGQRLALPLANRDQRGRPGQPLSPGRQRAALEQLHASQGPRRAAHRHRALDGAHGPGPAAAHRRPRHRGAPAPLPGPRRPHAPRVGCAEYAGAPLGAGYARAANLPLQQA
nr:hypothetical protein [Tanacetum cinerariifolium]